MASGPEGTEPLNFQTTVLKVSIHCEACKKKVRKVLQRQEGVYAIDINSKQNKVTVTGSVDAQSLIRRLLKHNKHAELWPEKQPAAANSSGEAAGDANSKPFAAAPAPKTEQQLPNTEQQQTEESKNKTTPLPTTEATPSPPAAAAAAISGDANASKPNIDEKDSEKPADASEEADDGKKKEKIAQRETSSKDEKAENASASAAAAGDFPSPAKQFPAYAQPVYSMSYSAAQPSTSYAYYMPSSYTYSGYPPPPPENYSSHPYYGSMEAPAGSGESYHMFNDENPNACNLM